MRRVISIIDPETNELVEPREYAKRKRARTLRCRVGSPVMIADFAPDRAFISPVDGSLITSRRDREEHNRRNGVVDVGDDPMYDPDKIDPNPSTPEVDYTDTLRELAANPAAVERTMAEAGRVDVDEAAADVGA